MFCKNCGKKLSADAKFCRECGTKVEVESKVDNNGNKTVPISKSYATASLVLGIISFFRGWFLIPIPILGLIFGVCQKGKSGEKTAGIIINAIVLFLITIFWVAIFFFAFLENNTKSYESIEDNRGNSDIIINDDYNNNFDLESLFE